MTNETIEATSNEIPADILAGLSKLSPEKLALLAQLQEDDQDSLNKLLNRAQKKQDEKAEEAQKKILAERETDITAARKEFYADLFPNVLGITIPSTGITLKDTVKITQAEDGTVSVEISKAVSRLPSTGPRASRGTGNASGKFVINASNVAGFQGYNLPDGSKNQPAAAACRAVGIDQGSSSAAAFFTNWAAKPENRDAANKVLVMVDGEPSPAGDFVAKRIAPMAQAPTAPAPAPAETAPASA